MDTKCILLGAILLTGGFGLGFAANNLFTSGLRGNLGTQLSIGEIEWLFEDDFLIMRIPINNIGTMPVTIQSINVRKDVTGSIEYTDSNPIGIFSGSGAIASGGGDTFEWNAIRGSAPFDFLSPGNTYVIKIVVFDGYYQRTATAPSEWA